MADFKIEIYGDYNGNLSWHTLFNDGSNNETDDADVDYIINIARELGKSLKSLKTLRRERKRAMA